MCRDGTRGPRIVFGVTELDHVEGRAAGLLDVEVVAAAIGVDGHVGMDTARDRLDREGLPTRYAVDLKTLTDIILNNSVMPVL